MTTMRFRVICALMAGALLALPSVPAWAQPASESAPATGFGLGAIKVPPAEKTRTLSRGLRFGRSVFHAGLAVEGG